MPVAGEDARFTQLCIILRQPKAHAGLTWGGFGGTGILPVRVHRLEACAITAKFPS
jgi:hypothetical protein